MSTRTSRLRMAALLAVLALLAGTRPSVRAAEDTKREPCCFANPKYSGTCQVDPAEDETCAGILAYLNNPNSSGKSYCSNTDERQGWALVKCK
jgi:hypothetical protein